MSRIALIGFGTVGQAVARILCSGECNIRVDLLLVIPVLWIVSIVALVKLLRTKGRHGAS